MRSVIAGFGLLVFSASVSGQRLVVTAEGQHGSPGEVRRDDVSVEVNRKPVPVKDWTPLRGDAGALELFVVIDDGVDADLGNQFGVLKSFVTGQSSGSTRATRVGLAYLRNGGALIASALSADSQQFAKALRLPLAQPGIASSPYMGISELIKKWSAAEARREVLLISSGIDPWSPRDPQNPYLLKAIADAQRAGILVSSIYYSGAGHSGHSYGLFNWGQNYLSELADGTGGEAYWQGFGSPVSLDAFLKQFAERLQNQYLLTIAGDAVKGDLEPVRVLDSKSGVSLVSASRIYLGKTR